MCRVKSVLQKIKPYALLFLVIWILYYHLYKKGFINNEPVICLVMRLAIVALVVFGIVLAVRRELDLPRLIVLCVIAGMVMRIGYTFYTPWYIRAHDVGKLMSDGNGHAAYIYNLFTGGALPASYDYQFYHPPLFHILAAWNMKLFSWLFAETDVNALFDCCKLISCLASCYTLLFVRRICRDLKLSEGAALIVMVIFSFSPHLYFSAGRVNNDALSTMFMIGFCMMLIRWWRDRKFSQLMGMAVTMGLGMMTKLNVGTLALIAGPCMLYVFWQSVREHRWVNQLKQYIAFLLVCAPLGLWYSIRNLVLFGQPLGYVNNVDSEGISFLYRGDMSFVDRFLSFPLSEYFISPYNDSAENFNVPIYLLKSSVFGEFQFENMDTVAFWIDHINIILVLLSLVAMVLVVWKGRWVAPTARYGCVWLWAVVMGSYIIFNIKYPDMCTADFRYVVPALLCGSVYLGVFWEKMRTLKRQGVLLWMARVLQWIIPAGCGLWAVLSVYMFTNLS